MQTLEIISINLGNILISLCNLLLLFLGVRHFLFKPVKAVLAARQAAIAEQYEQADSARTQALEMQDEWKDKMRSAREEADGIVDNAVRSANEQSREILEQTRERAAHMIRSAEAEAQAERRRAEREMKHQIADVSVALAEKIIGREINAADHNELIDSFIAEIGDGHAGDE